MLGEVGGWRGVRAPGWIRVDQRGALGSLANLSKPVVMKSLTAMNEIVSRVMMPKYLPVSIYIKSTALGWL